MIETVFFFFFLFFFFFSPTQRECSRAFLLPKKVRRSFIKLRFGDVEQKKKEKNENKNV